MRRPRLFLPLGILCLLAPSALGQVEDPAGVVRDFLAHYAGGDLAKAGAFGSEAFSQQLVRQHARAAAAQCRRIERSEITAQIDGDGDKATAEARVAIEEWSAMPGGRAEIAVRRFIFELTREGGHWRIDEWSDADVAAADAVAGGKASASEPLGVKAGEHLVQRAITFLNQNDLPAAKRLIDMADEIAEREGNDHLLSLAIGARAALAAKPPLNDRKGAQELAAEAVAIAERSGNPDALASALLHRTVAHRLTNRAGTALPFIDRGLGLADYVSDATPLAMLATQAAGVYDLIEEHPTALTHSLMAERYAEESGSPTARLGALMNLGGTYARRRDWKLAIPYYQRALELSESLGFPALTHSILGELTSAEISIGDFGTGLVYSERALAMNRDAVSPEAWCFVYRMRVTAWRWCGELAAAERELHLMTPWAAQNPDDWGRLLRDWGRIRYEQKRYEESLTFYEEAWDLNFYSFLWRAYTFRALGRHAEAEQQLQTALAVAEHNLQVIGSDPRQLLELTDQQYGYALPEYVALLVECGRNEEALDLVERYRARVLRGLITSKPGEQETWTEQELTAYRRVNERLKELNRIASPSPEVKREIEATRLEVEDVLARVAGRVHNERAIESQDGLANLGPDVAIVEFHVTGDRTTIFTAISDGAGRTTTDAVTIKIGSVDLKARASRLVKRIEERHPDFRNDARELYDLLLAPVAGRVFRGGRSICFVTDGTLERLPFHALIAPDGRYVLEKAPVFYAPSSRFVAEAAHRRPRRAGKDVSLLALGNPAVPRTVLKEVDERLRDEVSQPLPEAEEEVKAVAAQYGANSRVLIGPAASEATLKQQVMEADVLHIASHGIVDSASPLYNALLLSAADGDADDGRLEAREIMRLPLQARMVVLSACDTALGGLYRVEGVVGLSWAFLAAGCPTTVISQWKAESKATSMLMIEFHRQLRRGHAPPEALRLAQLALLKQARYSSPLYWAPFIVYGAGV